MSLVINDLVTNQAQIASTQRSQADAIRLLAFFEGFIKPYSKIDLMFQSIDSLSSGTLTQGVLTGSQLTCYLKHVDRVVQQNYPTYQLAMPEIKCLKSTNTMTASW